MNIINKRINELIAALGAPADATEREHNAQMLRNFIRAYGTSQRVSAVRDQQKVFVNQGLVAVDAFALNMLTAKMQDLAKAGDHDLEDADTRAWLALGAEHVKREDAMTPRNIDDKLTGPEFQIEDSDMDTLLNVTATLLSGHASMDTGLAWSKALDKVMTRLKLANEATKYQEMYEQLTGALDLSWLSGDVVSRVYQLTSKLDEMQVRTDDDKIETVNLYQTRYRIHMVIANILGRLRLGMFKSTGNPLSYILPTNDELGAHMLFSALGDEFGIEFDAETRAKMMAMNSDALAMAINVIPNKKGLGQ